MQPWAVICMEREREQFRLCRKETNRLRRESELWAEVLRLRKLLRAPDPVPNWWVLCVA